MKGKITTKIKHFYINNYEYYYLQKEFVFQESCKYFIYILQVIITFLAWLLSKG